MALTANPWQGLDGPNLGYVHQLYERYRNEPASVGDDIRGIFDRWGAPPHYEAGVPLAEAVPAPDLQATMQKAVAAVDLVRNIRLNGHLVAQINSFTDEPNAYANLLNPLAYGLSDADLQIIPAHVVWPEALTHLATAGAVIDHLRTVYTGTTAYQFIHITDMAERNWLSSMVETGEAGRPFDQDERKRLLLDLTDVEEFEHFLHRTFAGQKRFSVEGLEVVVPMLHSLIDQAAGDGAQHVLIGMAHRGRLSVLAHVLGKPLAKIFSEFHHAPAKEMVPSEGSMGVTYGWTGDVKYHLGANRVLNAGTATRLRITLAHNPSHLEFVGAVVEGCTRAAQDERSLPGPPRQDVEKALCVSLHGDAAFPGEGIVAETFNLSRLSGYQTGGTIHLITNNQIGFTTDSADSRSTRYCSGPARGFEVPIVHVNADDPEACLRAVALAYAYRKRFHKDFVIDLIGYRRYGHNEADDPVVTQPRFYAKVAQHPGVRQLYAAKLQEVGVISGQAAGEMQQAAQQRLTQAFEQMKSEGTVQMMPPQPSLHAEDSFGNTRVKRSTLAEINNQLLQWPAAFAVYPKVKKILERRIDLDQSDVDWAHAESLAFATILAEGRPVRLSGQDAERGTFAQRNLVLHDVQTGAAFTPLQQFPSARAAFALYNSPLSETAVLGFEYGYDVLAGDTLVIWEAQFGDFANVAQVVIDQFLAAGRAKWGQASNLVLLLPHGYEGQGPEHSSARLERFLQLSAERNWTVASLTRSAQYFHLLRWQASQVGTVHARPLILMAPKSLLRNQRAASAVAEFCEGEFQPVLTQQGLVERAASAERLVLSTGKIGVELAAEWEAASSSDPRLCLARVELLYPFPEQALRAIINRCRRLEEVVWVQEEPQNMGAWGYIAPRLRELTAVSVRYIGRPERSSPAEGVPEAHKAEQSRILREALLLA
ncbi:MAG TPA: 2-oxoglutarate dehydrogenase E1 component [Symbiobacteriaceae bacterium]|nr:2-oxoglutarate dehydrogenase E1 component [Symbiobacteriaceae bacterium]